MHEYRLADAGRAAASAKKGSLRLDDWVLCRLYNKKNEWEKMQQGEAKEEAAAVESSDMITSHSHSHSWGEARTPESEIVDNDPFSAFQSPTAQEMMVTMMVPKKEATDDDLAIGVNARNDLFMDLSNDDIQSMYIGLDMLPPGDGLLGYSLLFASPRARGNQSGTGGMPALF